MEPHYLKTREDLKKLEAHAQKLRERFPDEYARIYAAEQSAPDDEVQDPRDIRGH